MKKLMPVKQALWLASTYCQPINFALDFWREPLFVLAKEVEKLREDRRALRKMLEEAQLK